MLDRNELGITEDIVKAFEYMQDAWYPDNHYRTDKIDDDLYGWVYKMDCVEDEFCIFINTLYSYKYLKNQMKFNLDIKYLFQWSVS